MNASIRIGNFVVDLQKRIRCDASQSVHKSQVFRYLESILNMRWNMANRNKLDMTKLHAQRNVWFDVL